jgi:hypothetical protein
MTRIDGSNKVSTQQKVTGPDPDADAVDLDEMTREKPERQLGGDGRGLGREVLEKMADDVASTKRLAEAGAVDADDFELRRQELNAVLSGATFDLTQLASEAPELAEKLEYIAGDLERIESALDSGMSVMPAAVQTLRAGVRTEDVAKEADDSEVGKGVAEVGGSLIRGALSVIDPRVNVSQQLEEKLAAMNPGDSAEISLQGFANVNGLRVGEARKLKIERAADQSFKLLEVRGLAVGAGDGEHAAGIGLGVSGVESFQTPQEVRARLTSIVTREALAALGNTLVPGAGTAGVNLKDARGRDYESVSVGVTAKGTASAGERDALKGEIEGEGAFNVEHNPKAGTTDLVLSAKVAAQLEVAEAGSGASAKAFAASGEVELRARMGGGVEGKVALTFQAGAIEGAINIGLSGNEPTPAQRAKLAALEGFSGSVEDLVGQLKEWGLNPTLDVEIRTLRQAKIAADGKLAGLSLELVHKRSRPADLKELSKAIAEEMTSMAPLGARS